MINMEMPKGQAMSKEESDKLWAEWSSVGYWEKRQKNMKVVGEMFEQEQIMWKYCIENKCSVDDLINAHKKTKELI